MAQVTVVINADGTSAQRELVRVAQAQDGLTAATDRAGASARKHAEHANASAAAFEKMGEGMKGFILKSAGLVGVEQMLERIGETVTHVLDKLAEAGRKQGELGLKSVGLAQVFPGMEDRAITAAAKAGQPFGIKADEAQEIVRRMAAGAAEPQRSAREQAALETAGLLAPGSIKSPGEEKLSNALADAKEVFRLRRLGFEGENTAEIVAMMQQKGRTAGEAGSALMTAAGRTRLAPGDFASVSRALEQFQNPEAGLGIASALAPITSAARPKQLVEMTQGIGQLLNGQNEFTKNLQKALDVDALRAAGGGAGELKKLKGKEFHLEKLKEAQALLDRTPRGIAAEFGTDLTKLDEFQKMELATRIGPGMRADDVAARRRAAQKLGADEKQALAFAELSGGAGLGRLREIMQAIGQAEAKSGLPEERLKRLEGTKYFGQGLTQAGAGAASELHELEDDQARKVELRRLEAARFVREKVPFGNELFVNEKGEANMVGRAIYGLRNYGLGPRKELSVEEREAALRSMNSDEGEEMGIGGFALAAGKGLVMAGARASNTGAELAARNPQIGEAVSGFVQRMEAAILRLVEGQKETTAAVKELQKGEAPGAMSSGPRKKITIKADNDAE